MKIKINNKNNIIKSVHLYRVSKNIIGMRVWTYEKWGCKLSQSNLSLYENNKCIDTFLVTNKNGLIDSFDIITGGDIFIPCQFFVSDIERYEINAIFCDPDKLFPYDYEEIKG